MKLKLTTKPTAAPSGEQAPSSASAAPTPGSAAPKIKFKLGAPAPADGQASGPPKQKRKYNKKPKLDENGNPIPPGPKTLKIQKRPRDEVGDGEQPIAKRKPKPTAKSLEVVHSDDDLDDDAMQVAPVVAAPRVAPVRQGSTIKLKVKPTSTALALKIKHHGRVPVRPPGVGYDSEAEEAEEDPAIESQFILRMQPGPDCDLLRKAIEEKKIGKPSAEGGTMVVFRFFDGEGRRAIISIQNRLYAAAMVDLPCVIESMKSWNKKDWVKTADVCQMLLVLGRVANEEEAKRYPLPQEVHPHKHQYPHGLTPPMHWVRRRRFRPRQSYHEIEQRETMVNKLLAEDESARTSGGSTEYEIIDENKPESDMGSSDEDAEGEEEDIAETTEYLLEGETPGGEEIEVDNNELAAALAAGLMEDEVDVDALFGGEEGEPETPLTSHDVAVHALGENAVSTPETAVTSPNAATSPDDDDDDDDDAESAQEDEIDAQAVAAQEGLEQGMTEIRELEQEIAKAQEQLDSSNNVLYKQRCKRKIEQLQTDLGLKKAALGIGDDGD